MTVKLSDHFTYKKIFKATISPILMMVFTSLYCIVDGIFVSNFAGLNAFAGINMIFPVTMIIGGLGFMIGSGGAALVSKTIGEGLKERANKLFSMIIYFTLIFATLVSIAGYFMIEPLAYYLASFGETTQEMIDNAIIYGQILMLGELTFMLQNMFQSFFMVAEKPTMGFVFTIFAGIANMVLDYLLIGILGWGVVGAAIATITSQAVGGVLPLFYFIFKKDLLIRLVPAKIELKPIIRTCTNGVSEFIGNISSALIGLVFNVQLLRYIGEQGLSAYGIIMYVQFIFIAIFIGYTIGVSPIVGYNFGSKNHEELKNVLKKSLIIILSTGVMMFIIAESLSRPLCLIFASSDEELIKITEQGIKIFSFSFIYCGIGLFTSAFFTALNNGLVSGLISTLRMFVYQILCIILLPLMFDTIGIWLSVVVSEFLSLITSFVFLIVNKKKYQY